MASAPVAPGLTAFIALRIAQPIRLGVQKRVQCLLHRPPYQPVRWFLIRSSSIEMTLPNGSVYSLSWRLLLAVLVAFGNLQFSQFGAASPTQLIAVGTLITERPPHRSERAQLRHSAPTLGV